PAVDAIPSRPSPQRVDVSICAEGKPHIYHQSKGAPPSGWTAPGPGVAPPPCGARVLPPGATAAAGGNRRPAGQNCLPRGHPGKLGGGGGLTLTGKGLAPLRVPRARGPTAARGPNCRGGRSRPHAPP